MSASSIKENVLDYIHHLTLYDYIAFGWILLFFILLLIFSILISSKRPILATIFILFDFLLFIFSPILVKTFINQTVKKTQIEIINNERLIFGKSVIVTAKIVNKGKIDFKECEIKGRIVKAGNNFLKNFIYKLKPLKKRTIFIKEKIPKNSSYEFKMVFNDFKYAKNDYNISIKAECY